MRLLSGKANFDFLGQRKLGLVVSLALVVASIVALALRGLNFGLDFTGGSLVEVGYPAAVEIETVRNVLEQDGFDQAVVQHFGTAKDVLVRLPAAAAADTAAAASISDNIMLALRRPYDESLAEAASNTAQQQCRRAASAQVQPCAVQMRRVEFVGPQVGDELTNRGGLAMLFALFGIFVYVMLRFRWQFSAASIVALVHDVLITVGAFAMLQVEFSLAVLAAVLAVIGYSLNDTIVVFDRIRENFRKMRTSDVALVLNTAINQTMPRTILTSMTTLLVVFSLLFFGGEVIRGFALALLIGVLVGTYSSIFVASPTVLVLRVSRQDMLPVEKEGASADSP